VALLTVMKGLPLAYQKDMQEDKLPVFEAADAPNYVWLRPPDGPRPAPRPRAAARGGGARLQHRTTSPTGWSGVGCRSAAPIM